MNILFRSREFPPQPSGVETCLRLMGEALILLGHKVVLVTARTPGLSEHTYTACDRSCRDLEQRPASEMPGALDPFVCVCEHLAANDYELVNERYCPVSVLEKMFSVRHERLFP